MIISYNEYVIIINLRKLNWFMKFTRPSALSVNQESEYIG